MKATHFVMAVNDHFSAKLNVTINEIHTISNGADPKSPTENPQDTTSTATPAEDLWALRYITVHRAQPLIEAIDDDGSSFITVNEVNAFTSSRPQGWRYVPHTMSSGTRTHWFC